MLNIETERFEKDGKRKIGFKITIPELKDKIRKLLKDPVYNFDDLDLEDEKDLDGFVVFDGCQAD